jgi:pyridoxamine 5'-phosphate oxidase
MTRNEILDFVRKNTTSWMATVEDGEPRVRGMDTPVVDEKGLTFCTGTSKPVSRQLLANPSVELCYFDSSTGVQMRLRGRMEKLDDEQLKRHIVETRFTFLKPVVESHGWETLTLFRLPGGRGSLWSASEPGGGSQEFEF